MVLRIGVERLNHEQVASWGRFAVLCNHASLDRDYQHTLQRLAALAPAGALRLVFGPQHGVLGEAQDNMRESCDSFVMVGQKRLPVRSLYGPRRIPGSEDLAGVDTLVVDLQISGCRVYTFKATLKACLQACMKYGVRVVVLDRPNPLGGDHVAGPLCAPALRSLVGPDALVLQHGLTVGELARFFCRDHREADLEVVPMEGWESRLGWHAEWRDWVATSPNLPNLTAVRLYPGMVLLEGTNLSEGRGTTQPFEQVGHPALDGPQFARSIRAAYGDLRGVVLRPVAFEPIFGKWCERRCYGVQFHLVEPGLFCPVRLGLAVIEAARQLLGSQLGPKAPPYEYEFTTPPLDLLLGRQVSWDAVGVDLDWSEDVTQFRHLAQDYQLYPRATRSFGAYGRTSAGPASSSCTAPHTS